MRRLASIVLACLVSLMSLAAHGAAEVEARELEIFKTWLKQKYDGYGCDEGPARFRNAAVEAAYGGRRFYYVLTHERGIPPPFKNALSLVASIDDHGRNLSLTAIDVRPSALSGLRNIVDVIFSFTNRATDVVEKQFLRVDVTEEFPFLVTKMSPYYSR